MKKTAKINTKKSITESIPKALQSTFLPQMHVLLKALP